MTEIRAEFSEVETVRKIVTLALGDAMEILIVIATLREQNSGGVNETLSDAGAGRAGITVRNALIARLVLLVSRAYAGAITAVFTVVLAISTIALWGSTRDAARGAERSAKIAEDTLTVLERPWIFVHIRPNLKSRLSHFGPPATDRLESILKADPSDEIPLAIFDIANHGRMPAVIDGCWVELGSIKIEWDEGPP